MIGPFLHNGSADLAALLAPRKVTFGPSWQNGSDNLAALLVPRSGAFELSWNNGKDDLAALLFFIGALSVLLGKTERWTDGAFRPGPPGLGGGATPWRRSCLLAPNPLGERDGVTALERGSLTA